MKTMKTKEFKFDDSHNVQLSQGAAAVGGRLNQSSTGLGILRAAPGHVRSGGWMKRAFKLTLVVLLESSPALQAATTVTNIAAGEYHSLFIKSDGSLWGMGDNSYAQLGDGTLNSTNQPVEIVSNSVMAVAAGDTHSLFIKSDGSLWGMGDNYQGQLGDGTNDEVSKPEEIVSNSVVAISAGGFHSLFIKSDGSLWDMGDSYSNTPEEIISNGVAAISAGEFYSLFRKSDGSLWGMGHNEYGQLGDGSFNETDRPEEIVSNGVVAVAAGGAYTLFLKSDGSLWGMGDNRSGELGDGTFNSTNQPEEIVTNGVVAVAAEGGGDLSEGSPAGGGAGESDSIIEAHSLFLKSDGSLWGMGDNYGNSPVKIVPGGVVAVAAGASYSLFLKSDGSFWSIGGLGDGFINSSLVPEQILPLPQPVLVPPLLIASVTTQTVTHIAAGEGYSLFAKSDGSLWAMGDNSSGQLGDGTTNNVITPEKIVSSNVVAAATGAYEFSYSIFFGPVVSRSGLHTLLLKSDGSVWAMGDNYYGQLGNGTFNSTNQPEQVVSSGVVAVAAGGEHSLFLKSDGSLWGMGNNGDGELGDGTFNSTNQPEEIVTNGVVAVAAGVAQDRFFYGSASADYSLFLKSDGSLWGMGYNGYGQLGDGTFNSTNQPEEIVSNGVVAVAAGGGFYRAAHSLFIESDGSLWGMGDNSAGQLGAGTNVEVNTPTEIVSNGVVAVAAGSAFSLFLKSDGSLWGMGDNSSVQLGVGTTNDVSTPEEIVSNGVVAVAAGSYHSLFLKSDGSLWGMGDNGFGELGNGSSSPLVPEKLAGGPWLRGTCFAGGTYRLLSSTNTALPVSQWTPVWTNTVVHRGPSNFSAPLPDDVLSHDPQRFYILQAQ
jgi:alpha-tubulin suppressor-like RCC1 family protein